MSLSQQCYRVLQVQQIENHGMSLACGIKPVLCEMLNQAAIGNL